MNPNAPVSGKWQTQPGCWETEMPGWLAGGQRGV